ncbi:MAG: S-layer homology domain-containing protein, partial [Oscillospiraceae bacterium]
MAGSPGKTVAPTTWYSDAQKWAMAESVSDGNRPTEDVTREQLATILYRYAKAAAVTADMSGFTDTGDISTFAKDGMSWAVANKILQGSAGKLNPQETATRAEVAAMLQRFLTLTAQ